MIPELSAFGPETFDIAIRDLKDPNSEINLTIEELTEMAAAVSAEIDHDLGVRMLEISTALYKFKHFFLENEARLREVARAHAAKRGSK